MKVILGIQEAHDASAVLMTDGEIIAAAQEERFTGLKGDYGYPKHAIAHCLRQAAISASDIDVVALASLNWNPVLTKIKRNANFSVDDWLKEQREYWKPVLLEGKKVNYYNLFKDNPEWCYDDTYDMDHLLSGYMDAGEMEEMKQLRRETVSALLNVPLDRVRLVTHEDCHTFYSYFGSHLRDKTLALTTEGIGDYSNGTVSEFCENGRNELASTKENHLGHIYQYMTLLLGMKPAQHEYKVMGLAPYADEKETQKSYEVFSRVLKVVGLNVEYDDMPDDLYFWFRDNLEGHRFDGIAGGLQRFLEERLCEWVRACHKATGLTNVCFSGGVAQNIKACKKIAELDEVNDICVCPAAGDTSLPIGACYYVMWEHLRSNGKPMDTLQPFANIYLGPEFTSAEVRKVLDEEMVGDRYQVTRGVGAQQIAEMLADGKVIARCCGRMEFGLRALGNRSILADPRDPAIIQKINSKIKFRDFWMPFTPTILAERESDYIVNTKGLKSPFMTMAFDSTPLGRQELIAALHPADFTIRPQILREEANPEYHKIVKAFERLTGVGGLLNTSFNLHGEPIALGPREAIHTMDNSDLDGVILEDYLVMRRLI